MFVLTKAESGATSTETFTRIAELAAYAPKDNAPLQALLELMLNDGAA